jgi:hypothetical protein
VVTGVDDKSRFRVIAAVVRRATGRALCLAFAEALQRFGIPERVLTAASGSGSPAPTSGWYTTAGIGGCVTVLAATGAAR